MSASPSPTAPELPTGSTTPGQHIDFRALYDAHVGLVFRTLRRFGVPDSALDDATQDVFTIAYTKRDSFEGRSAFNAWVFGIARRVARNHRLRPTSPVALADLDAFTSHDHDEVAGEKLARARLLYRLLDGLDEELREIFLLVELEGFTLREAGEALEENPHTLASRLARSKKELKNMLTRAATQDDWRVRCPS